jgi:hypothetical protein
MHEGAAMPVILIRSEAKSRHLSYLIERLKTCPITLPADDGAPVEEMVERAYWDQVMGGLRRGLDESKRLAKVLH